MARAQPGVTLLVTAPVEGTGAGAAVGEGVAAAAAETLAPGPLTGTTKPGKPGKVSVCDTLEPADVAEAMLMASVTSVVPVAAFAFAVTWHVVLLKLVTVLTLAFALQLVNAAPAGPVSVKTYVVPVPKKPVPAALTFTMQVSV
jgi:hypothetical protein